MNLEFFCLKHQVAYKSKLSIHANFSKLCQTLIALPYIQINFDISV